MKRDRREYLAVLGLSCILWAMGCWEEDATAGGGEGALVAEGPGTDCSCDIECRDLADARGICVFGVCMNRPFAGPLSAPSCPDGTRLLEIYEYGGFVCFPECAHFECEGHCDRNGLCIDTEDTDFWCDPRCSSYCSDDSQLC